ncbi:FAD-dependent oxidoreductase [Candidatus Parcubacteria bacterium]|nr:MAG: FAD-dependent oxidoreductase [Candidatus Parcubacteria bacterium]
MQGLLPEKIESIWIATTPSTNFPTLERNLEVDVVVIGGGIVGLNTAYFLKNQGIKTAVVEAGRIAMGTSGNTTAKATSLHGLRYAYLTEEFGKDKAQVYAESNEWAISELERIIKKENINCDFYRAPSFTYTKSMDDLGKIKQEVEVALGLGLPASFAASIPGVDLQILGAVRFDNQAYFHPRKYLLKIAELINSGGSYVWENSRVVDIKEGEDFCKVVTSSVSLKAKSVVVATNFPFYDPNKIFSELQRSGSFVIACSPKLPYSETMFIGTRSFDMSFRPHKDKDKEKEWLIIGARHGEAPGGKSIDESFEFLAGLAEKNFQIKSVGFKWGAADTMSRDLVPYIGRMPGSRNIFVATGFSAWGMTPGLVAARLLTDLILGKDNEWESLYDPGRLVFWQAQDYGGSKAASVKTTAAKGGEAMDDLKNGEGKIIPYKGRKAAVYKDENGKVFVVSANCTFEGCLVNWNAEEKVWDCPCCGSRYSVEGKVLRGPATKDLEKI